MSQADPTPQVETGAMSRAGLALIGAGFLGLLIAGLLLWWREGDRLFTDGLIAAIVACF
ncbi:hypothetical protein [Bosea sp. (in: a-proteobacteria)]|uniref:hypothetical protein n=1 Tax=Bosea sp. (in: a-proteobacteria) TaxID=1871050 RepID=UPI00260FAE9D|nr:hypothetical protein [Bosea sp. (in: a-proteobacteria)]MCO5090311.1 hypothetical protein [Bosea sp. (in: a-proteobacteria)]